MLQPEKPYYIETFEQVLPRYRDAVVARVKDNLATTGLPVGSDVATELLLGTYLRKTPSGLVKGDPIYPEELPDIIGLGLNRRHVDQLTSRLGQVVSQVVRPYETVDQPKFRYIRETISPVDEVDTFGLYLQQASQEPLLKAEEEVELAQKMQRAKYVQEVISVTTTLTVQEQIYASAVNQQGVEARDRFIRANTRLVVSIAKHYQNKGLELADLVQEGNIGLIKAVEKFDSNKGLKFSTIATPTIKGAISKGIDDMSRTIRVSAGVSQKLYSIEKYAAEIAQEQGGVEPTDDRLAELFSMTPEALNKLRVLEPKIVSYEALRENEFTAENEELDIDIVDSPWEKSTAQMKHVTDPDASDPVFDAVEKSVVAPYVVGDALRTLTDREREVITMRFGFTAVSDGEPMSLREIGKVFGLTQERIRQIESKTLSKLRHPSRSRPLSGLMDTGTIEDQYDKPEQEARYQKKRIQPQQDTEGKFVWNPPKTHGRF